MNRIIVITLIALLFTGCLDDETPATPSATQPPPGTKAPTTPSPTATMPTITSAADDAIQFVLPELWQRSESIAAMRVATITTPAGSLAISRIQGEAGGVLNNVNRWRDQVSLPHITAAELPKSVLSIQMESRTVTLCDLEQAGGGRRILAAIYPGKGETWFFKLDGPGRAVSEEKERFVRFLQSVRIK